MFRRVTKPNQSFSLSTKRLILICFLAQSLGCSQTIMAHRQMPKEDRAVIQTDGKRPVPPNPAKAKAKANAHINAKAQGLASRAPAARKPPQKTWWERSRTRKVLRRGRFLAREGVEQTARVVATTAAVVVPVALGAGLLYADLTDDGSLNSVTQSEPENNATPSP